MTDMNKEREAYSCCNTWFESLPEGRKDVLRDDKWMLAHAAFEAGRASLAASAGSEPVAWTGGEEWEQLAWHLCAEEHGEDACDEVIWEGGPIPEPWGARWMKYESEAKRMIELVRRFYTHPSPSEGMAVTDAMIDAGKKMLHNSNGRGAREKVERIFNAMIAAAPPASEAKGA